MKRQRGRNRNHSNHNNHNKNNNNPNRSLDSNGPDGKVRGNASTIYEKYTSLARDAKTSGSRVKAENFLQHAEHYLRLMNVQEAAKQAAREEREAQEAARAAKQAERREQAGDNNSADTKANQDNPQEERKPRRQQRPQKERQDDVVKSEPSDALEVVTPTATNAGADAPIAEEAPKRRRKAPARKPAEAIDAAE